MASIVGRLCSCEYTVELRRNILAAERLGFLDALRQPFSSAKKNRSRPVFRTAVDLKRLSGFDQMVGFCQPPYSRSISDIAARTMSSRQGCAVSITPSGIFSGEVPARTTPLGQPAML